MGRAELKRLTVERFKSYPQPTSLEIAPLTVLLGRNNSGKSSLIQALLLLKQTLEHPRADVPLHLEGAVEALHLRELTSGWPETADFQGPSLKLVWESDVDVTAALASRGRLPDLDYLAQHSGIGWMTSAPEAVRLETTLTLSFDVREGTIIPSVLLESARVDTGRRVANPTVQIQKKKDSYRFVWLPVTRDSIAQLLRVNNDQVPRLPTATRADRIEVELDHFIPLIHIDKRNVGPRHRERTYYNGFKVLYEQPLEDLRRLLTDFHYLGSTRVAPSSIYRPATVPPQEVGVNGEYAAQMLHARKVDVVHFVPPPALDDGRFRFPEQVLSRSLSDAFDLVMHELGIVADLDIKDIADVGFRLLFGGASLQHVGRGIGYLLPAVLVGLVSDPLRFQAPTGDLSLTDYLERCPALTHAAIEEPEIHLHPKVQTRLAHWFVALAMAGRRLIVETHSDHLVRRLRGLIARAPAGSELERWLADNVVIAEIEQTEDGRSQLTCSRLTETGGIAERWPADFMDEGADEERSIYYAGLEKSDRATPREPETELIHDPAE
jgi:predicted ATPase